MSDKQDSGQYILTDSGELVIEPRTWDGEPLYSVQTVQEGLFGPHAFEQMPGQTAMGLEDDGPTLYGWIEFPLPGNGDGR